MTATIDEQLRERLPVELATWNPSAHLRDLRPLPGGESSITYVADLGGCDHERVVVKAALPGVAPVRNRDVLRQARILRELAPTAIPVPGVLFTSTGDPPEVPPLFVMTFARGSCFEPNIDPADELPAPSTVRERAMRAASAMADLHSHQLSAALVADAPVVALDDEVARWYRVLGSVDPTLSGDYVAVSEALVESLPDSLPPVLIHGDFRLGNMLFDDASLTGIIDWEIWSRGDPRVDLAWFMLTAEPTMHPVAIRNCPGMATSAELLARYSAARSVELPRTDWFRAFTLFKFAAIVALIVKHRRRGGRPDDEFSARIAPRIPGMIGASRRALDAD